MRLFQLQHNSSLIKHTTKTARELLLATCGEKYRKQNNVARRENETEIGS